MENKKCISYALERKTGVNISPCNQCGKCGRYNVGKLYVCKDGPVSTNVQLNEIPAEY